MAAKVIGSIEPFNEKLESFAAYTERLEMYFEINEIEEEKKKAALLSLIGPQTYNLLRGLTSPDKPKEKTFDELITLLQSHLSPKPFEIAERYRFYLRSQKETENTAEFIASLKQMTEHCNFGAFLSQALRDRFVCGLSNSSIQKKLLCEHDLTLEKALTIATAMEQATKDANEIHKPHDTPSTTQRQEVFKVTQTLQHCLSCGKPGHPRKSCRFYNATCHRCNKRGHIASVCRSTPTNKPPTSRINTHSLREDQDQDDESYLHTHSLKEDEDQDDESDLPCLHIFNSGRETNPPILVNVCIQGKPLEMELDTGSSVSVIPLSVYESHCAQMQLQDTNVKLRTYGDERITPIGIVMPEVKYGDQCHKAQLFVVDGPKVPLFGRSWLQLFKLDWPSIKLLRESTGDHEIARLIENYSDVFSDQLGTFKGPPAKLHMREGAIPVHQKFRSVPFSIRPKVEAELEELEKQGIISPVTHSEWATPVVPVVKKNGSIRLCGDYKVTVNPNLVTDTYPLPTLDDLQEKMNGGCLFSKLDLSKAYSQIPIHDESKQYTTLNTHKGLYAYNRLPFGVSSAAAIFQRNMDLVFRDMAHVLCYQDDILVTGSSRDDHILNLTRVLQRLQQHGLTVQSKKCEFLQPSLKYLGHLIDSRGIHPLHDKVEAIKAAPTPKDVAQLRSFLGLVNYYQKFLPNLSETLHPLHQLLQKGARWEWSTSCQKSFNRVKSMISADSVLAPYDPKLPLILDCDASAYGLGAVLSHRFQDGSERPIAFASRTLNRSEQNYAQIEKEALSIVFGVTRFHIHLHGRRFTLRTDHQPLMTILGPKKGIPPIAAMRMQRWSTKLSAYNYEIQYRSSGEHANADAMSRLPWSSTSNSSTEDLADTFQIEQLEGLPVTAEIVRQHTANDPTLQRVYALVQHGPQGKVTDTELQPYCRLLSELSLNRGCIMRGHRVIVPNTLQAQILNELHEGHLGVVKMKEMARNYIWWPRLDQDIEALARSCVSCNSIRNSPPAQRHPWQFPSAPWERIHIDFAGPLDNLYFLLVIDAYSKWLEVVPMRTITASATIQTMREIFARFGIPSTLVSDNGPQLTSSQFAEFLSKNGVKHITTAPYHPASNGQAERYVQTFKQAYAAGRGTTSQRITNFLLQYRNAPNGTTRHSPAQLMLGRRLRTRLDLVSPNDASRHHREEQPKVSQKRWFHSGKEVWFRDFSRSSRKWSAGTVVAPIGNSMYEVQSQFFPDCTFRRHVDQLLRRDIPPVQSQAPQPSAVCAPEVHSDPDPTNAEQELAEDASPPAAPTSDPPDVATATLPTPKLGLRRSSRTTQGIPPNKLNL